MGGLELEKFINAAYPARLAASSPTAICPEEFKKYFISGRGTTNRAPTQDEVVEEAKRKIRHQTTTRFVHAKPRRLQFNSPPDSDPEALEPFVPSAESDSEVESEDGAFTGREHYEAVGYARPSY